MDARRISLAVGLMGLTGLATAPLARADDAASPAERAAPIPGQPATPLPQGQVPLRPGATQAPTMILVPDGDEDDDGASPGSTGTLLILIPKRAPETAPQQTPHAPPLQSPSLVPTRQVVRILEA